MRKLSGVLAFVMAAGLLCGAASAQETKKLTVKETQVGKLMPGETRGWAISPDGNHLATLSKRETKPATGDKVAKWVVTLDGVDGKEYDWIVPNSLEFSADSTSLAYIVQQGGKMFAVVNGQERTAYHEIVNSQLMVAPAGARFAYYAKVKPTSKTMVVIDAEEGKEFEAVGNVVFSPDGKRVAYGVESLGKMHFIIDGQPSKEYEKIAGGSFTWSPDSKRYAFGAVQDGKIVVVVDGQEQLTCDEASRPTWSQDSQRFAYSIRRGKKMTLIVDGKEQKEFDVVLGQSARFSPDGKRIAYLAGRRETTGVGEPAAQAPSKLFFVIDGEELRAHEELVADSFNFSPDSKRTAYVASKIVDRQRLYSVVIDGIEGKDYEKIANLQFSPDSKQLAYLAERLGRAYAVVNNSESVGYLSVARLIYSADGGRMAYVAARDTSSTFVVVDNKEGKNYEGVIADHLHFSPDGKHVAFEAKRGKDAFFVLDGEESAPHNGSIRGSRVVFSGNDALHGLIIREGDLIPGVNARIGNIMKMQITVTP
jgi:Tol biopolymer transport system component